MSSLSPDRYFLLSTCKEAVQSGFFILVTDVVCNAATSVEDSRVIGRRDKRGLVLEDSLHSLVSLCIRFSVDNQ